MNFNERMNFSERVRYCSCHRNIKSLSSSQLVVFFLLYGETTRETNSTKAKGGNRDVIERYDTHKGDILKICHSGSRMKWRMESTSGLVPNKTLSNKTLSLIMHTIALNSN